MCVKHSSCVMFLFFIFKKALQMNKIIQITKRPILVIEDSIISFLHMCNRRALEANFSKVECSSKVLKP